MLAGSGGDEGVVRKAEDGVAGGELVGHGLQLCGGGPVCGKVVVIAC